MRCSRGGSQLLAPSTRNVLGILSLVFWTLLIVVSLKYMSEATYYIEHQAPVSGHRGPDGMMAWRDRLPGLLMRNSLDTSADYQIPSGQVVDLGLRVRI